MNKKIGNVSKIYKNDTFFIEFFKNLNIFLLIY